MATRTLGMTFTIVRLIALIGGDVALAFANMDEQENQDQAFPDADRTDRNDTLTNVGWGTVIVGGIFFLTGLVLVFVRGAPT